MPCNRSGESDPLALAAREQNSALAYFMLQAFGQFTDKIKTLGHFCRLMYIRFRYIRVIKPDIILDGVVFKKNILRHIPDIFPPEIKLYILNILAIKQYFPR